MFKCVPAALSSLKLAFFPPWLSYATMEKRGTEASLAERPAPGDSCRADGAAASVATEFTGAPVLQ